MARMVVRFLLAALFLVAATLHLGHAKLFLPAMPPMIPFPMECILISGVCEFLGGIGLLVPRNSIRRTAAWGLALLLVAVFPANIYMATAHVEVHGFPKFAWLEWARLPLQPLLIWAVLWSTRALNILSSKP